MRVGALLTLPLLAAALLTTATPASPAASAATGGVVLDGNARFEVLTPTLIRLEYAGDGVFQDGNTLSVPARSFPAPAYTTSVSGGYRVITTSAVTLRYREGSGPFTPANLAVQVAGTNVTAAPAFPSYCAFGAACEAENALLSWGAGTAYDHANHTGSGFVAGFTQPNSALSQDVSEVPAAGSYPLTVRYANWTGGDGQTTTRTLSTTVNGAAGPTLTLPTTGSWDTWATATVTVPLRAGVNTIGIVQRAGDSGNVNLDSLAVTAPGAGYPPAATGLLSTAYGAGPTNALGGWTRSLDNESTGNVVQHPGILDRDGWYLLDDSRTALLNPDGSTTDRPDHAGQSYQDGYFFGYGADYKRGLADLNAVTGGTNLLPESAYGVWYSWYYAYTTSDYQNTLLPAFRNTFTPLDWLVVDTDWKSPSQWNGWNWNPALFPDPQGFLDWTKQQGLAVSMNIHTTIAGDDPQFAAANATAGGLTRDTVNTQFGPNNYLFDWSQPAQRKAYFDLHQPFEQQGVRQWWLDYCTNCGNSTASDPHVAPDNLINQAYADDMAAKGLRGFSFGRIGSSPQAANTGSYAVGPWSERRNTLQFTGDTYPTWDVLALEARFAGDEAAAGLSNVSHDIGSFHANHLADDLYARWVQLGTFQPVDRLHSDHGDRLPWNYGADADASAESFLRLRAALVPYTYTLAQQAHGTGVPIIRPLYLDYPGNAESYSYRGEYLYGDDVLVAPITTPNDANGNGSVSVWFPPGTWTDYFTGTSYTGPSTSTVTAPLSRMPVFLRSGGVLLTRTDYTDHATQSPLTRATVTVGAGGDGGFALYQDAGEGTGYQSGQSTSTPISWRDGTRTLTVGATTGGYPGAPASRAYTLRLLNATAPTAVSLDGTPLPETAWGYNPNTRTVTVTTAALPVGSAHTVSLSGSAAGNPTSGEVLGLSGLCLAARGGVAGTGTAAQLGTCDHGTDQQVSYTAGNAVRLQGKCLDAAGGGTGNGTAVQWWDCNSSGAQSWTLGANGALRNPQSGRCLDVPNADPAAQLQLYDCNGTAAQTWQLPPGPVTGVGGLCLDARDADPSSPTPVQLYGCNQTDAQRWSTPGDGTLRVFGKCLDAAHGGTGNGTAVQLFDCNGSGAQSWLARSDGSLLNPASGRCLDDPNGGTGVQLQLWDCSGAAGQQYRLGG